MTMLTTREAAERLGVTMKRVQAMIRDDRLPAQKVGRDYIIQALDVERLERRPAGRPPNKTPDTNKRARGHIRTTNDASTSKSGKKKGGKR